MYWNALALSNWRSSTSTLALLSGSLSMGNRRRRDQPRLKRSVRGKHPTHSRKSSGRTSTFVYNKPLTNDVDINELMYVAEDIYERQHVHGAVSVNLSFWKGKWDFPYYRIVFVRLEKSVTFFLCVNQYNAKWHRQLERVMLTFIYVFCHIH
jgi:hypothetical protein